MISSTALYNAAKHKGLRGLAHPIYGTSFETFFGQTSENFYSTTFVNKAAHGLTEMVEGYEPTHRDTIVKTEGVIWQQDLLPRAGLDTTSRWSW